MGGGVKNQGSAVYLNVSKGKLVNKKKGLEYDGYFGKFDGIRLKPDSYKGQPTVQVQLRMIANDGEVAIICFNQESWFCIGFFQRIENVDLKNPFMLGVFRSDKVLEGQTEPSTTSFCYLKQVGAGDKDLVAKRQDFPKPVKVDVGKGKTASNYEKVEEEVMRVLTRLASKLGTKVTETLEKQGDGPPPLDDDDLPR